MKRPRGFTENEMKKVGITIVDDQENVILNCDNCGQGWLITQTSIIQAGGKMPRGYWKCPRACNHDGPPTMH